MFCMKNMMTYAKSDRCGFRFDDFGLPTDNRFTTMTCRRIREPYLIPKQKEKSKLIKTTEYLFSQTNVINKMSKSNKII